MKSDKGSVSSSLHLQFQKIVLLHNNRTSKIGRIFQWVIFVKLLSESVFFTDKNRTLGLSKVVVINIK